MLTLPAMNLSRFIGSNELASEDKPPLDVLMASINKFSMGVLLIDRAGKLVLANNAATTLLARADGLHCRPDGQLDAYPVNPEQPRLNIWLGYQCSPTHVGVSRFVHAYLALRANNMGQYSLQCCPLNEEMAWQVQGQQIGAVVFASDPEKLTLPSAARLASLYGFTNGQALVAYELALGNNRKEIARNLKITPDTVRSHTQKIYGKMGVNSQANLMRTILTLGHASL